MHAIVSLHALRLMLLCLGWMFLASQWICLPNARGQPVQATILTLSDTSPPSQDAIGAMEFLAPPQELTYPQVAEPPWADRFVPWSQLPPPDRSTPVWARLRVQVSADSHQTWLLSFSTFFLKRYRTQVFSDAKWLQNMPTVEFWTSLHDRELPDALYTIKLNNDNSSAVIYLKFTNIRTRAHSFYHSGSITIISVKHFYWQRLVMHFFLGSIFGIFVIVILYNFVLYHSSKEKSYLWLALSLIGFSLYCVEQQGLFVELFPVNSLSMTIIRVQSSVNGVLGGVSFYRFIVHFLSIKNERSWIHYITVISLISMGVDAASGTFLLAIGVKSDYMIYNASALVLIAMLILLMLINSIKGSRLAIYLLISSVFAAFGFVVQIMLLSGLLSASPFTLVALPLGLFFQISLLSIALADRMRQIRAELAERDKSERLLLTMLPAPIANRLKGGESPIADRHPEVTVLFADIVGFTKLSGRLAPEELVQNLNTLFSRFDALTSAHGLEKIKTIGDCYMVVGGLPTPRLDHVAAVADLALALRAATAQAGAQPLDEGFANHIQLRIGLHCGPAIAGVIGTQKPAYDLWGDTVNIASRMESHGQPGTIHCSEAVYVALREQFAFAARGDIEVRSKGRMRTYTLLGRKPAATP